MKWYGQYLSGSEMAVMTALLSAHDIEGEPVTAYRVYKQGNLYGYGAPYTPPFTLRFGPSSFQPGRGGWTVFHFPDRTKRFLERLVRMGVIGKTEDGKYYPLEGEE